MFFCLLRGAGSGPVGRVARGTTGAPKRREVEVDDRASAWPPEVPVSNVHWRAMGAAGPEPVPEVAAAETPPWHRARRLFGPVLELAKAQTGASMRNRTPKGSVYPCDASSSQPGDAS
ncbi:Hypothetical protein PHPALM_1322 [Phytophthora palmivora]|uniref:Uncharacterized protein n=1 Tax=Phytophthora palmivora TaxID=4796 RepID=A0A2P4YSM3_9STRA|nr:Hypothetical protein PHPALM_1322 [Phytophthora palmivora]